MTTPLWNTQFARISHPQWRQPLRAALVCGAVATALSACSPSAPSGADSGQTLYEYCVACHRDDGSGRADIEAPSIAGLPGYYVEAQLIKYRDGIRGNHPDDVAGLRMRPMSKALSSDEQVKAVAAYVASMKPVAHQPTLSGGDPQRGQQLFATCSACHGPQADGMEALKSPGLRHLQDWYLLSQLKKLKSGVRGANPDDVTGAQMRPMAASLVDEQAMLDVIAYIKTL